LLYPVTNGFQNQAIFIGHGIEMVQVQILEALKRCEITAHHP
jgi:hypothetical protein